MEVFLYELPLWVKLAALVLGSFTILFVARYSDGRIICDRCGKRTPEDDQYVVTHLAYSSICRECAEKFRRQGN